MIDREKVIKGFECCSDWQRGSMHRSCEDCPYNDNPVMGTCDNLFPLFRDALAILKADQAQAEGMTWHTMDTLPARGEQVLLWRGLTDDDGGFPSIARAVSYMGETLIRYKPEGEDWQELTRDEYPGTMWARIPRPEGRPA